MTNFSSRCAKIDDVEAIHLFGVSIPELKVSNLTEFMSYDEVYRMVTDPYGEIFIAESDDQIVGFCYGSLDRTDIFNLKACLIYMAVIESFRQQGIASRLYESVVDNLKRRGAKYLYAWANPLSGVSNFFIKKGLKAGESRIWFDQIL